MGSRFPDLVELGPLTATEWDTLRSLNRAYIDLRQEWETARAVSGRLMAKVELTEGYTEDSPYQHHLEAVDAACSHAIVFEQRIGEIAWHHASAAVVLGMTVLDRLLSGGPPLSDATVKRLAGKEATLGELSQVCGAPYDRMLAMREDVLGTEAQARAELHGLLKAAYYNVTHTHFNGRRPSEAEARAFRLTVVSEDGVDGYWEELLAPVLRLAESLPYAISWWLDRHGAKTEHHVVKADHHVVNADRDASA